MIAPHFLAILDLERLQELLLQGPEKLGYEMPLWTCARVAHLIDNEFDVEYPYGQELDLFESNHGCGRLSREPPGLEL